MINHFRTLLFNLDGSTGTPSIPGEEIIDPSFVSLTLPPLLSQIRATLFGVEPDRYYLNYQVRTFLGVVQAGPLAAYVPNFDTRITYRLDNDIVYFADAFVPNAIADPGSAGRPVLFIGDAQADDTLGKAYFNGRLEADGVSHLRILQYAPYPSDQTLTVASANNVLGPVALGAFGLQIVVDGTTAGGWNVNLMARPVKTPDSLLPALMTLAPLLLVGDVEPMPTCRNLWNSGRSLPDRLGAFLLAYVLALDTLRKGTP
jgi:hypothetical protein